MGRTKFQNYAEYYSLKIMMGFLIVLGKKLSLKFASAAALFVYYFIPYRKEYVRGALKTSFPEKSDKEITKILKNTYKNFFAVMVDIMFFPRMSDEQIKNLMVFDDKGRFEQIHKEGKGCILLSAHFGNWELTALSFSKRYPMSVVTGRQSNDLVDEYMMKSVRTNRGYNAIAARRDDASGLFRGVLKALKNNHFVAILSDQDAGGSGVFVPFFGRPASTPKGAALFALRAKCPIITALGVRQKDGTMQMTLQEITLPNTGNQEEDVKTIMAVYTKQLEDAVRKNPEQWFWFHRKWKTQPKS